ncbi:zona pellucida sperm-binding protein 3 [Astyanax mexicanus]|uniref:zona pellucida sperm-binding protein 3 n=1 Tax=Astyanax mexicanus TaxID=7994 RepID=UPI0020CAC107|nr:zona pellucida sperm-binding protein 3 [Astyanax mexicanus]
MECLVTVFGLLLSLLLFGVLNVECYANAPSPLVKSMSELGAKQSGSNGACSGQSCLRTVAVKCGKSSMEVQVKADLFGTGVPVEASELTVLAAGTDEHFCRVTVAEDAQYKIEVPFNKCGTGFQMNDDWLIYSNLLLYTPTPSPYRILRMSPATIPIQCWFSRKFRVSSQAVVPTWAPFSSTLSQESKLDLGMKLMTSDWSSELLYGVYQLGEVIHVEASVEMGTHMPLRVYVDSCVATQSPDVNTSPRYAFIENNGCMMDGLITSSTDSYFLPRLQNDRLRFQLEAFMFHDSPSNASVLFVTCILKAVLITQSSPEQRACSFIDGRWRSADDTDQVCQSCSHSASANSLDQPVQYNQPSQSDQQTVWKQQATLGPFVVQP